MTYTVAAGKKILGSFNEKANAELFAKAYTEATGTEVQVTEPAKKAEAETAEPAMESPVVYMVDHGEEALKAKLEELGYDELKALVKTYHLDPNRIYSRSKKAERLREGILNRAVTRATQGDCFKNFQG